MPDLYQLAPDVTQDLESITQGKAPLKTFLETRPELQVSRCEHHYIFHLMRENQSPLIIAILHERMNMIDRIRKRLEP